MSYLQSQLTQHKSELVKINVKCTDLDSQIRQLHHQLQHFQQQIRPYRQQQTQLEQKIQDIESFLTKQAALVPLIEHLTATQQQYLVEWYRIGEPYQLHAGYITEQQLAASYGAYAVLLKISNADLIAIKPFINLDFDYPALERWDDENWVEISFKLRQYMRNPQQIAILYPQADIVLNQNKELKRSV